MGIKNVLQYTHEARHSLIITCVIKGFFSIIAKYLHLKCLTSSFECLDQARLHTCDPVSTHCKGCPVSVFQNLIYLSAVPPPLANSPCWCGDQAIALTAAKCSV